jgi:peptidoglycan/xylan/chitin deacetylase (PgdA/CDA1 family)
MALSPSTEDRCTVAAAEASLPPIPSRLTRVRSRLLRETAALALPRSVLLTHGARGRARKRIALTFDDGPDPMTMDYLGVLDRLGVRATFFLVGQNIESSPTLVRQYTRFGHELGCHGWTHEPFTTMSGEQLHDELERTSRLLCREVGHVRLVRPPRGAMSMRALLRIAASGYTTVLWSVDSDDCRTCDPRAVEGRLARTKLASGDIVLLHELQPWTLQALPRLVGALRRDAWEFVTVSELLG